jgi:hypothetical protein
LLERTSGANSAGNGAWVISRTALGSHLNFSTIRATGLAAGDTSPFSKDWDAARKGEDIVNRHLRGEPTPLASPIAMMRLLLILSWRRAEPSSKIYRKSWLLNDLIPGFDTEALRVSPSISKGATAFVPLHLRVGLLAGMATAAKEAVSTVRCLRPGCRPLR